MPPEADFNTRVPGVVWLYLTINSNSAPIIFNSQSQSKQPLYPFISLHLNNDETRVICDVYFPENDPCPGYTKTVTLLVRQKNSTKTEKSRCKKGVVNLFFIAQKVHLAACPVCVFGIQKKKPKSRKEVAHSNRCHTVASQKSLYLTACPVCVFGIKKKNKNPSGAKSRKEIEHSNRCQEVATQKTTNPTFFALRSKNTSPTILLHPMLSSSIFPLLSFGYLECVFVIRDFLTRVTSLSRRASPTRTNS